MSPSIPEAFPWAFIFKHRVLTTQVRWGKHQLPGKEFNHIYGFWRVHSSYLKGITPLVHLCNEQKTNMLDPVFSLSGCKKLNKWVKNIITSRGLKQRSFNATLPEQNRHLLSGEPSKHEVDSHICSSLQNPWDKLVQGLPHLLHRPWFIISW